MKKFLIIISVLLILIFLGLGAYWGWQIYQANKKGVSVPQLLVEKDVGEGPITIQDPKLNTTQDVNFKNKEAIVKTQNNGTVMYKILDILQPFNIDNQGANEYPILLEADYDSGERIVYLVVLRQKNANFTAVDTIKVARPDQIDDLHSLNNNTILVYCTWGKGDNEEEVILGYTFANDKIIPNKTNIDITNGDPVKQQINSNSSENDSKNDGTKGVVALTFDDGPATYTPDILDILKQKNINATFFIIGQNAVAHPDLVKRVHDEGNEAEDHTYTHPNLGKYSYEAQFDEINKAREAINNILSPIYKVKIFRPPYGVYGTETESVVGKLDLKLLRWTVDPADWSGKPANEIADYVLDHVQANSIILLHDGLATSAETAKALPAIIDGIKSKGYKFVTMSQLIDKINLKDVNK